MRNDAYSGQQRRDQSSLDEARVVGAHRGAWPVTAAHRAKSLLGDWAVTASCSNPNIFEPADWLRLGRAAALTNTHRERRQAGPFHRRVLSTMITSSQAYGAPHPASSPRPIEGRSLRRRLASLHRDTSRPGIMAISLPLVASALPSRWPPLRRVAQIAKPGTRRRAQVRPPIIGQSVVKDQTDLAW